ncbi:BTB/POZ domain-containing protein 6-like [Oculina patagonica]
MKKLRERLANLSAAGENWQTACPTIRERTGFLFNKELLSDVKLVVPIRNIGSDYKSEIPAHKFVLAISSPVFFAMFYGQMAETTDSIELSDCDRSSLLEMLRYLYSDEVRLNGSNVMQLSYLAKKYMVPSLDDKCTEFLRDNLKAYNVLCILPYAQKFEDKELENRCWKVIETQTKEAIESSEFRDLERPLVESIVKRDGLNMKEVLLFQAVDRWATKECRRRDLTPSDEHAKRRVLGDEIVNAIRYPLMTLSEFASVVIDCNILTFREIADIVKHYAGVSTSPLSFSQVPRIGPFQRCRRFRKLVSVEEGGWYYHGSTNEIRFTVDKDVVLHGVQHFGSEEGKYEVSIKVKEPDDSFSRFTGPGFTEASGSYNSDKEENEAYYGFDVMFDHPIWLENGKVYEIVSKISGPHSWYGLEGKSSVECAGVSFNFKSPWSLVTGVSRGQFPAFIFTL